MKICVYGASGNDLDRAYFDAARELEAATGIPAPAQVAALRDLPVLHSRVCDRDKMGEAVLAGFDD